MVGGLLATLVWSDKGGNFNSHTQSAEEKLGVLYTKLGEVRDQGKVAAHYFCDDRNDFLDMVFVEVKEFTDEFKKTVKVI